MHNCKLQNSKIQNLINNIFLYIFNNIMNHIFADKLKIVNTFINNNDYVWANYLL